MWDDMRRDDDSVCDIAIIRIPCRYTRVDEGVSAMLNGDSCVAKESDHWCGDVWKREKNRRDNETSMIN